MWVTQCQKPTIWGWFIAPAKIVILCDFRIYIYRYIYIGDGLSLVSPHCHSWCHIIPFCFFPEQWPFHTGPMDWLLIHGFAFSKSRFSQFDDLSIEIYWVWVKFQDKTADCLDYWSLSFLCFFSTQELGYCWPTPVICQKWLGLGFASAISVGDQVTWWSWKSPGTRDFRTF